ncbi:MAG: glycosyltransferase [Candidatus Omnitrophota bacterium]
MNNPFISVIIPVHNDSQRLKLCLDALQNQSYPRHLYEIIVVDNNSTESIKNLVEQLPNTVYAFEGKKGSYAARNTGIKTAQGEILAFTDSDCIPSNNWLEEGVKPIIDGKADLVGGKINLFFRNKRSPVELYDFVTFLNTETSIKKGVCQTANLFAPKNIFQKEGLFPCVESGGDRQWTKNITSKNYRLLFSPAAIVKHPTRNFKGLIKKSYRIGKGVVPYYKNTEISKNKIISNTLKSFLPPKPKTLTTRINKRSVAITRKLFIQMWILAVISTIIKSFGIISTLFIRK